MKILCIFPDYFPKVGGIETFNLKIFETLKTKGHKLKLITSKTENKISEPKEIIRVIKKYNFIQNLKLIIKEINNFKPDVIFLTNAGFSILSKLTEIPIVCRTAGNDFKKSWYGPKIPLWEQFYYHPDLQIYPLNKIYTDKNKVSYRSYFAKKGLKTCIKIISNSNFVKNDLLKIGIETNKIEAVIGGIDTEQFSKSKNYSEKTFENYQLPKDKKILLTVGHLKSEKNHSQILEAIKRLEKLGDIFYLIVGSGNLKGKIENEIKALKLENYVKLIEGIKPENIHKFYQIADIYIQYSKIETMGRAICEAMSCRLPVIGSNIGGIPDVIQDGKTGLIAEINNVEDLTEKISRVLTDSEFREKIAQNAEIYAKENYSWEVVSNKIETILIEATKK
ncbi:MAG: glycosyltransferase family 1 protein [Calditrichaeota bacterium]|nr:MAG: glycosyltransferase family 1 protein [Calditrichota bacterium]